MLVIIITTLCNSNYMPLISYRCMGLFSAEYCCRHLLYLHCSHVDGDHHSCSSSFTAILRPLASATETWFIAMVTVVTVVCVCVVIVVNNPVVVMVVVVVTWWWRFWLVNR